MNVAHELRRVSDEPLVLAIGFFDGMHRGHQQIARVTRSLRRPGWRTGVLSFSNHPAAHLRPGTEPQLICTPEERLDLFAAYGYEECFFVPFDDAVASIRAAEFVSEVLVGGLRVRGVIVGDTFRFGHKREGDTQLMATLLEAAGVAFLPVAHVRDGERISSTRIRKLIARGALEEADRLLGHAYEVRGRVTLGAGRGRHLGFPTANVALPAKLLPSDGVYAATARYDGCDYAALASIGTNPTFGGRARTFEVWLRDFEGTIYGQELAVRDLRFVREQRHFDTAEALAAQMREDALTVAYPSYG